jgi:hypothetical protein
MEEIMSNQGQGRESSLGGHEGGDTTSGIGKTANEAFSKASDMAQEAAGRAKRAAADGASTVTTQVKELLDRQVSHSADIAGHFVGSARLAADDLDQHSPQLAGLVRIFADRVESYSDDLRDRSIEGLVQAASDITRRQPALVFGLAALTGFVVFRSFRSAPSSVPSPSIQPRQEHQGQGASDFHAI